MGDKYKKSVSTRSRDGATITEYSKGDGRIFEKYTPTHRTIETVDSYEVQEYEGRIFKKWSD